MKFSRPELLHLLWPAAILLPAFLVWAFRSADRARRKWIADELVGRLALGRRLVARLPVAVQDRIRETVYRMVGAVERRTPSRS